MVAGSREGFRKKGVNILLVNGPLILRNVLTSQEDCDNLASHARESRKANIILTITGEATALAIGT